MEFLWVFWVLIWFSGNIGTLFGSHERLVNYDVAYTKPAPFTFEVLNKSLVVLDNEPLVVKVAVRGEVIPDEVFMVLHNDEILLRKEKGTYNYTFEAPVKESSFPFDGAGLEFRQVYCSRFKHTFLT